MADIDVQPRGAGTSVWPWLIGLLVLALVVWGIWELLEDNDVAETAAVEAPVAAPVATNPAPPVATGEEEAALPAAVQEYLSTCTGPNVDGMALSHQFTSDCVQRLDASINDLVDTPNLAGVDVSAQLADAHQKAQQLVQSPETSEQHSSMARSAFTSEAAVLNALQDQRYPALSGEVDQLQQSAEAVQGDTDLLQQRDQVHAFFSQAGDVLRTMATTPASQG